MEIIETDRHRNPTREDLGRLLHAVREQAQEDAHPKLLSISLAVPHIDPLAVLESIYEAHELHAYCERPATEETVAGAEAVWSLPATGPDRFAAAETFVADVLAHTVAVGDLEAPFAGPHFFCGFTFEAEAVADAPFAPATVFVPRWQVGRRQGRCTAVANCRVDPDADVGALTERIWAAHQKFSGFDYAPPEKRPVARLLDRQPVGRDYTASVQGALEQIASGLYEKIVLARAEDLHFDRSLRPLEVCNHLRSAFPGCLTFSFHNQAGASWIGATPERLLRREGEHFLAEALAGTTARGATAAEDARLARALLHSDKDQREHRHVVDSLRRRFQEAGLEVPAEAPPRLLALPNVQHLWTPMRVPARNGVSLLALAAHLHPTPAVGGRPREAALPHLREWESLPRGLYSGLVGWLDHRGEGELAVALRCGLVLADRARLFAGAGIVAGSEPEAEYHETALKMRALLEAMGVA